MSDKYEAHKLAINNLEVIEQAFPIIEEVQKKVFSKIDKKVETFAFDEDWSDDGDYKFFEDGTCFQPKGWARKENDEYLNYFEIGSDQEDGEGGQFWLSYITGAFPQRIGINFCVDVKTITKKAKYSSSIWPNFLSQNSSAQQLKGEGFEFIGDCIFLPILIDSSLLADCYPNAIDDALSPVDDALDKIKKNLPQFEQIIKDADAYFSI